MELTVKDLCVNLTNIKLDETFELADVHLKWETFDDGAKRTLGKLFKSAVDDGVYSNVVYVKEQSNHHALYKKI